MLTWVLWIACLGAAPAAAQDEVPRALSERIAHDTALAEDCTTADWTTAMLYTDGAILGAFAASTAYRPVLGDPSANDALVGVTIAMAVVAVGAGTLVVAGGCRAQRPMSDGWAAGPHTMHDFHRYRRALSVSGGSMSFEGPRIGANREWPVFVFFLHLASAMGAFIPTVALPSESDRELIGILATGVLLGAVVYGVVSIGQQVAQLANRAWLRRRVLAGERVIVSITGRPGGAVLGVGGVF